MSNRKLLCFGYYFPPSRAPEAIVSAKRTVGLKGWDVTFVSFELGSEEQGLAKYVSGKFHRIVKIPLPKWMQILPQRLLSRLPFLPDWLSLITKYSSKKLQELQVEHNDVFMTCSQSHSSHLVGLEIKKAFPKLPWVAHFSDPWASNPYMEQKKQRLEQRLEASVFESADLLIFTSDETCNHVGKSYSEKICSKMHVLPHAYDPEIWKNIEKSSFPQKATNGAPVIIRHLGALYGKRSPVAFFDALIELKNKMPSLEDEVAFELVGPIDKEFRDALEVRNLPENLIKIGPPVSYIESLELMRSADALLVIDAPSKRNIFLPSKLIDYIGAGKPILALSSPGTTHSLVIDYGGSCYDPEDVGGIAMGVRKFLDELNQSNKRCRMVNKEVRDRFHVEKVGEKLNSYLDQVMLESNIK